MAVTLPVLALFGSIAALDGGLESLAGPATPALAGLMLLVAIPTTWIFALLDTSATVAVALGTATSLPLWFLLGTFLAATSDTRVEWLRRYVVWASAWAVASLAVLLTVASLVS